ncbi:MAG: glutamate-5-semialdehyde dehydrogenase, partial [Spirochaetaceae bacterium]|nr:glutamate-5-semialdehyde dehydrogenase [Spirochaetaceae bacterium]
MNITDRARKAREASRRILSRNAESRNAALKAVRIALFNQSKDIFAANKIDLDRSEREGLSPPMMKRLKFDKAKLSRVCEGIEALELMEDPMGRVLEKRELDKGLLLSRVAGPIGVIGMIFESRPDALVQIATLCLRSGNAVILKGGSEALETNRILTRIISEASSGHNLPLGGQPEGWIQLAETRGEVREMLVLDHLIDLLIPRGSNEFVAGIMRDSSIPVLGHADGICHVYLDAAASPEKSVPIVLDSKMQYVAVCNAAETLLVHSKAAESILPLIRDSLTAAGCELRGCERTQKIIRVKAAEDADWDTEYLDAILSIRIVDSIDEAVEHIHRHGSGHTEAIVTEDKAAAETFLARIDAADVFHNCSTRFADGFV